MTTRSVAEAKERWERAGIRNYDLEWTNTGSSRAHYKVTVRAGQVTSVESVLPDGKAVEAHPAEPGSYGVEGLFMLISDELALLRTDHPFGQPKGTKAVLRFTPDPKLGYPRNYRRDVMGSPLSLAIDVISLAPVVQSDSKTGPPS